jgi:hypothetical protein
MIGVNKVGGVRGSVRPCCEEEKGARSLARKFIRVVQVGSELFSKKTQRNGKGNGS